MIDQEVSRLLREAEARAVTLIRTHQGDLDRLSDLLVERETVDGDEVYRLLGLPVPEHVPAGQEIAPGRAAAGPPVPASTAVPGGGGPAGSGVRPRGMHSSVPAPGDESRPSTRGPNTQG